MNMNGEQRIAAPLQRVWEALNNPDVLRASIPGCQTLDKTTNDRFNAVVEVKVGPIGARFKGAVTLTDLNPPKGYTLILEGNGGIAGSVKGSAKVSLTESNGGTLISYVVDAQVGGRMAQLGGPIIDATAKQLAGKFFTRFGELVGGTAAVAATSPAVNRPSASTDHTSSHTHVASSSASSSSPITWILATVVAALSGFFVGRSQGQAGSDWAGLAIGLLVIVVAGAAFEYGRRSSGTVVMLDNALLKRLLNGAKE
jgi:carbon monoxide dehydrogenase subunit G